MMEGSSFSADKITSKFGWDKKTVIWEILNMSVAIGPPPIERAPPPPVHPNYPGPQEFHAILDIDYLNSLNFLVGKHAHNKSNWSLSLSKTNSEYLGLFIHFLNGEAEFSIRRGRNNNHIYFDEITDQSQLFKYTMSLVNRDGDVVKKRENHSIISILPGQSCGEDDFILLEDLWDQNSKLLDVTHKLTVRVEIWLFGQLDHILQNGGDELQEKTLKIQNNFSNTLSTLWNNRDFDADVKVKCGFSVFSVHKCVISAVSPVFKAMFSTDMQEANKNEVDIFDVEPEILGLLFNFMYTSNVTGIEWLGWDWNNLEKVRQLIDASEKYQVLGLKDLSFVNFCARLSKMDGEGVALVAVFMKAYNAEQSVKEILFSYIMSNFKRFREDERFIGVMKKNAEAFGDILMSDALANALF